MALLTQPETYHGPCDLEEALSAADPGEDDVRAAISVPNGDWVAFRVGALGPIHIRRVNRLSGRAGSIMETGEWVTRKDCLIRQWRPA